MAGRPQCRVSSKLVACAIRGRDFRGSGASFRQRPTVDGAAISCTTVWVSPRRTTATRNLAAARGALQIGVAGTVAAATLAEAVHMAVLSTTPWAIGRPLARSIYASVRGVAGLAGQGGDRLLSLLAPRLGSDTRRRLSPPVPLGVQAALNGVLGDRLDRVAPTTVLPMRLHPHRSARVARRTAAAGDVVFVHGLCMHDRHWQDEAADAVDLGRALSMAHELRPLYARYNSGGAIEENGRRLAKILERRELRPASTDRPLHLVAHSLGGLVVRSAIAAGVEHGHRWPQRLGHVVCLGTPHEGAPLERLGASIETLLALHRFSAPWAMLGRLRSIAIRQLGDAAVPSWPSSLDGVHVHLVAGCQTRRGPRAAHEHWGDGLVPVASALARSVSPSELPVRSRRVFDDVGHLRLLGHPEVAEHVRRILAGC